MKRILNDGTSIVLLRHVRPSGEVTAASSIPASTPVPDHGPKEVPI